MITLINTETKKKQKYMLDGKVLMLLYENKVKIIDDKTKKLISKIDDYIPLFDIFSETLFMISKDNVYKRVMWNSYRFPDKHNLHKFPDKIQHFMHTTYDLDVLENTYYKVIYKYSKEVGKDITYCKRPSFLPIFSYVKPYYTRNEIINMALNMEIIKSDMTYYDENKLEKLCKLVSNNDIHSQILLDHRKHIIESDMIGIVQYYSLSGSFHINKYLRNVSKKELQNLLIERIIMNMWKLVSTSPAFDTTYIVYRFVQDDSFLSELKVGDIFIDHGFVSTTRDPFYRSDLYKFGFVLIKIKIPKNTIGVGLSIESFSHFPKEQEIILPPYTRLKLVGKNRAGAYYHIDSEYQKNVVIKYEFELIDIKKELNIPNEYIKFNPDTTPLNLDLILTDAPLGQKIQEFKRTYVNDIGQFVVTIGDTQFNLMTEWYDSTLAYKGFYAVENKEGFSIYCIHNNRILFVLEIMELLHELHVNYYFRHSDNSELYKIISDQDFIMWLSRFSNIFNIQKIIIYSQYKFCYNWKYNKISTMGSFNIDFMEYFVSNKKRYEVISDVKTKFDYTELDNLKTMNPSEILFAHDTDELYQIWKQNSKITNIIDFYVYIVTHYCNLIRLLESKMVRIYSGLTEYINPFLFDYYVIFPHVYLYNRGLISYLPNIDMNIEDLPKVPQIQENIERGTRINS